MSNLLKCVSSHLLESQKLGLVHESFGRPALAVRERTEQPLSLESQAVMSKQRLDKTRKSPIGTMTLQQSFRQIEEGQEPKTTWGFGFACITGSLQLEFYQSPSTDIYDTGTASETENIDDKDTDRSLLGVPKARIKVTLPRWWSSKVIETLVYRSQVGWSQLLRTRNVFPRFGERNFRSIRIIRDGDLEALVKQFDQRQLAPGDEFGNGWNLVSVRTFLAHVYNRRSPKGIGGAPMGTMDYLFIPSGSRSSTIRGQILY